MFKCIICYDNFDENINPITICFPCKHIFCEICISKWLINNNTCPKCRNNIEFIESRISTDFIQESIYNGFQIFIPIQGC